MTEIFFWEGLGILVNVIVQLMMEHGLACIMSKLRKTLKIMSILQGHMPGIILFGGTSLC